MERQVFLARLGFASPLDKQAKMRFIFACLSFLAWFACGPGISSMVGIKKGKASAFPFLFFLLLVIKVYLVLNRVRVVLTKKLFIELIVLSIAYTLGVLWVLH